MADVDLQELLAQIKPTDEQLASADEAVGVVIFLTGTLVNGEDFHMYASILPSKLEAFLEAESRGNYVVSDFGEVLMSGAGKEPPEFIKQHMQSYYGITADQSLDLEDYIEKEVIKLIEARKVDVEQSKLDEKDKKESELRNKYHISKKDD